MKIFGIRGSYFKEPDASATTITVDGYPSDDALVQDINVHLEEKASVVQCFGEKNYVFAFGHNPAESYIKLSVIIFLMDANECEDYETGSQVLSFFKAYDEGRVSKARKTVVADIAGAGIIYGIMVSMDLRTHDVEHNILVGTLTLQVISLYS